MKNVKEEIKRDIKKDLKNIFKIIKMKEMRILPGNVAFFIVLSIVPIISLISYICSSLSLSVTDVSNFLLNYLPFSAKDLLINILSSNKTGISFFVMCVGFFASSNGTHALILTSNTLYGIKDRNYFSRRIKALFMLIIIILLFITTLLLLAFGNKILNLILSINVLSFDLYIIFKYIKYLIAFIVIFFFVQILYTMAPDKKISSVYSLKGALFTTFGIIIVTALYSFYANNIAYYNVWYGSLSNLIVLIIWIYIISYIIVIGIAINSNEYKTTIENK